MFQKAVFHHVCRFRHADSFAEIADGTGGIPAPPKAAQRRHTRIIPAGHLPALYQRAQFPLAHDSMVNAQPRKLNLPGTGRQFAVFHHPVIERAVILKFQRTEAVGNALQSVLYRVGEVVHRIDAPFVPVPVVGQMVDTVDNGIAQIKIVAGEINFRPQRHGPVGELPRPHPPEQVQTLFYGTVPPRAARRNAGRSPVLFELFRRQLAHIGQSLLNQQLRLPVILLKVVGTIEKAVSPVKAQPVDVLLDGLHKLLVLFGGVGVVHAQIAQSAVFFRRPEINGQRLAVADMEIAVRFRGKTGVDRHSGKLSAGGNIFLNKGVDKIPALFLSGDFLFVSHTQNPP